MVDKTGIAPVYVDNDTGLVLHRCWAGANSRMTDGFIRMLETEGLENSWITNVVKSGRSDGDKPTDEHIRAWAGVLKAEIEIAGPAVIAVVGKTYTLPMFEKAVRFSGTTLNGASVVPITHYSIIGRGWTAERRAASWSLEFGQIKAQLEGRRLTSPVWLPL